MTYNAAKNKLMIETVLMWPFVALGKIAGYFFRLNTEHDVFLFFPNGDIGGSPQVNIDLTNCIRDKKPLIVFSKKPNNNEFREKYDIEGVRVLDIHKYIDNKAFHFINFFFRGLLATWINRRPSAVIFGGESIFFYKMLPHLKKKVHTVELCHLPTWLPYSIGFIDRIDCRVFSTLKLQEAVEQQYRDNHLGQHYFEQLYFFDNAIDIPVYREVQNKELKVYFIGRGAAQKRVHLVAAIAKRIHEEQLPVMFNFVGDVEKVINPSDYPYSKFYGNVKDQQLMKTIYETADVLLLTSSHEGLPIVVMQMMAHGKVVISTAVNGIPDYIAHLQNGLLISATTEHEIINEGVTYIKKLLAEPSLAKQLGLNSREIAIQKFSRAAFCGHYRKLLKL
ncbi:glycosyltransferase family 4 protein [Ferruginibacter sp. HRS2-29]|uniref:glycosyltransferase family 4 protein n=1 Tax=Ferruginibacter sp. HRS2-29 TaxID=2487334 RepID=UPI0020CFC20E|nr:glycosyltransferase family 4 protein [Ferruginibacter sp. HRS2-29]MCP9750918.1 glycosyltransferase [Ferruginibacter sp. HRS2-29]